MSLEINPEELQRFEHRKAILEQQREGIRREISNLQIEEGRLTLRINEVRNKIAVLLRAPGARELENG